MPLNRITYNGFTFPFARLNVTETPVYADDRITQIGIDYVFEVSGVVSAETHEAFQVDMYTMRTKLRPARHSLAIQWSPDGTNWTSIYSIDGGSAGTGDEDAWGPQPGELQLSNFAGGLAAIYSWTCRAFRKECFSEACDPTNPTSNILAISRRYQHAVDCDGLTTRTVSGKLICTVRGAPADSHRDLVVPILPTNFERTSQSFEQSEDRRELSFSITDTERVWTKPKPITSGQATFAIHIQHLGATVTYTLAGKFGAPANISKRVIVGAIVDLLLAKLPPLGSEVTLIPEQWQITESVYENALDFNIVYSSAAAGVPASTSTPDFTVGLSRLTVPPPNSTGQAQFIAPWGDDGSGGSSGVLGPTVLQPYDACGGAFPGEAPSSGAFTSQLNYEGPGPRPSPGPGPNGPGTGISQAHKDAPYIVYQESISYELDNALVYFEPKTPGQPPIKQQVHPSIVYVIQAGYASRYAADQSKAPKPPKPFNPAGLMRAYVQPDVPEPVGDGSWNKYTVHWRFIMRVNSALGDAKLVSIEPTWPKDPRRPDANPESLDGLPDLALVPTAT